VEFTLRDGQPADFDTLWRIDQDCFPPRIAYSRFELASYTRRRGAFTIVAETQAAPPDPQPESNPRVTIAGFVVAESNRRANGHIITIDVLPAYRRAGLGSKLLSAAEDRLRGIACHTVLLEAAVDNSVAIAFYKLHGYQIVRTIPRYYPDNINAFVLEKDLAPVKKVRNAKG
jgi:[ribosomal protein S18]-alanine N-acetyltransferase